MKFFKYFSNISYLLALLIDHLVTFGVSFFDIYKRGDEDCCLQKCSFTHRYPTSDLLSLFT